MNNIADERKLAKLQKLKEYANTYGLMFYQPYAKQREFHLKGVMYRERLLMAGNKLGKTFSAGFETAYHVTGIYPPWWDGYRFPKQNRWWVGSVTGELTRDGAQRILLGNIGRWGSGCIPKDLIVDIKRARGGVADAVETVLVRNCLSGEVSQITFKAYSDGREAWQAEDLDGVWFDEEPPEDIYMEGVTRTNNSGGPSYLTFTPLLGMSNVVMRFTAGGHPDRSITNMTIDDVEHYTAEQKRRIIDSYPPHEKDARTLGIPMLGSGRIYQVAEEVIREAPLFVIPQNWTQIIGLDFGWDHPTAAVKIVIDPDADCFHLVKAHRQSERLPVYHAAAIKPWGGDWIPVAWPQDGTQHDAGGQQTSVLYRDQGLNMLSEHAQFPDKRKNSVADGITEIHQRMMTSRWKVDANLSEWFDEFRMYHRKDGKVVKERDDLMDASRYAMMMARFALPGEAAPTPIDRYALQARPGHRTWMAA